MFNLMIVDDEPLTRQFFKNNINLLHPNWQCIGEAADGEEALKLLASGDEYHLVVTDIKMPGMSGLELAKRLSELQLYIQIVVLSGFDEFTLAKEAMQYGVSDYLLKPVVNEEITAVLNKVAQQLSIRQAQESEFQSLYSLSKESKIHIARNFIRAVITDNHTEIKVLYPWLHRLKISMVESEAAILLVDLEDSQIYEQQISSEHMTLYRYIIYQTATELTSTNDHIVTLIDPDERILFYVSGKNQSDIYIRCETLFKELSNALYDMTKLQLRGAVGTIEVEVFQIYHSYLKAIQVMKYHLFSDSRTDGILYIENANLDVKTQILDQAILSIYKSLSDANDTQLHATIITILRQIEYLDSTKMINMAIYLLNILKNNWIDGHHHDCIHTTLRMIQPHLLAHITEYKIEDAVMEISKILHMFYANFSLKHTSPTNQINEHEVVTKVKTYIMEKYAEPLSLAQIAEHVGISYSYLSSLFFQNTQESYSKYLTRIRLEHAASMLRHTPPEKISDIAEKVGYISAKHFSHLFKQQYGMPPGQYQEKFLR